MIKTIGKKDPAIVILIPVGLVQEIQGLVIILHRAQGHCLRKLQGMIVLKYVSTPLSTNPNFE